MCVYGFVCRKKESEKKIGETSNIYPESISPWNFLFDTGCAAVVPF